MRYNQFNLLSNKTTVEDINLCVLPCMRIADIDINSIKQLGSKSYCNQLLSLIKHYESNLSIDAILLNHIDSIIHPSEFIYFAKELLKCNKQIFIYHNNPYLIRAIEVVSYKENIQSKVNYYLVSDNYIEDVTNSTSDIYNMLAQPLQDIANLTWSD